jgi:SNF2 family DNA or RNA helicase
VRALNLRPFQQEDVEFLAKHDYNALVANAPGTGKTIEVLACIKRDIAKLTPALIVCPSSVVTNWCREARKWVGKIAIHAIKDQKSPIPQRRAHVMVVPWSMLADRELDLAHYGFKMLVADEAHFAKNPEAQRSQALMTISKRVNHRLLLTGTPIVNTSLELDAINSYFQSAEAPPMIRRLLEDVAPDIPPKTRSRLTIRLRQKDRARYMKLDADFTEWLEAELRKRMDAGEAQAAAARALAAEALVKVGYLRRILGESKVYAAADWASRAARLGEPVVMFAEHQEVIRRLQILLRKQRIKFVTIDGNTTRKQRQKAIDTFQQGRVAVFIGSKAAKEGITLHRARHLMFVERYFTAADEEQAEDRIRRIGQKAKTTIWHLHAEGTIDDRLADIVETKRRIVRNAIGTEDIREKPEESVERLIGKWSTHLQPTRNKPVSLGLSKPLPPLPPTPNVHQIVFSKPRWNERSAQVWMAMHGYHYAHLRDQGHAITVWNHAVTQFLPGTFRTIRIAKDISAIVGHRRPESTRRKRRRSRNKRNR